MELFRNLKLFKTSGPTTTTSLMYSNYFRPFLLVWKIVIFTLAWKDTTLPTTACLKLAFLNTNCVILLAEQGSKCLYRCKVTACISATTWRASCRALIGGSPKKRNQHPSPAASHLRPSCHHPPRPPNFCQTPPHPPKGRRRPQQRVQKLARPRRQGACDFFGKFCLLVCFPRSRDWMPWSEYVSCLSGSWLWCGGCNN